MKYLSSGGMDVPSILLENKILRTIDLEGVQVDQKEMEKILKSTRVNHSIFKIIFLNSDKLNAHLYNCIQQLARNNKECFTISTHFKFGFKRHNNLFCRFS
jgi:molecular chaperone GrpE (heat shock protein)